MHFVRHYAEMVAAMLAGMVVLGVPAEAALNAVGSGTSELRASAPELLFLGMALIMTAPMVGLMRVRRHGWRPCAEMAASMFAPTIAVMGLMWAGVGASGTLMAAEHAAMLPAVLVAMLLRADEYAGHGHRAEPRARGDLSVTSSRASRSPGGASARRR